MVNPNSGHTNANNTLAVDGLRDGDVITSPSLTNLIEGVHGNGILRLQDTSVEMASRNEPTSSPGVCGRVDANTVRVAGGFMVLDGVLYKFANGPGSYVDLDLDNTQNYCTSTVLASGQESLYVVYAIASSDSAHASARVRLQGGTPVTVSTGVYPPTPSGFLTDPITGYSEENGHAIVLAVLRCSYSAGGGTDKVDIIEVNDKRVYVKTDPFYLTPVTKGSTGATDTTVTRTYNTGVNYDVELKEMYGSSNVENGDFGGQLGSNRIDVSALWISHQNWKGSAATASNPTAPSSGDSHYGLGPGSGYDSTTATYADAQTPTDVLYFSGQGNAKQSLAAGGAMTTVRLGSKGVDVFTVSGISSNKDWPLTSYGDQVLITTNNSGASNHITYEPEGEFPEGHMIWIKNTHGSHNNVRFNGQGISNEVTDAGKTSHYVFDGHTWYRLSHV